MIRSGALAGLTPKDIWELELWEYNAFVGAYEERRKLDTANAVMTGYYAAYYNNAGKKAKNPNEIIKKLFSRKQSFEEGLRDIERVKQAEQRSFEDVDKHN